MTWRFSYNAVQFASGAVFSTGDIRDAEIQVSNAMVYAPEQMGHATAPVYMSFDGIGASNGGWWKLSLNRETLVVTIEYTDSDAVNGKLVWTMTPDKCVSNTY